MPASRFFLMLEKGRKVRNFERVLDVWASKASSVTAEGFQEILKFMNTLGQPQDERPLDVVLPPPEPLKGEAARQAVMGAFKNGHRFYPKMRP
jgi:hypothetical protein